MKKIILAFGTRPELIKLAPVIKEFIDKGLRENLIVVNTHQHSSILTQHLDLFDIQPDYTLNIDNNFNNLSKLSSLIIKELHRLFSNIGKVEDIKAFIVQGDTSSAFCSSLFAFYNQIPVHHIEAGLRTYHIKEPFPEEFHRHAISHIAAYHYAPTELNKQNLLKEGFSEKSIIVSGNTIIDSIKLIEKKGKEINIDIPENCIICTIHRRENHGKIFTEFIEKLKSLALSFRNYNFILIKHPNPALKEVITHSRLEKFSNVKIIEPLSYPEMLALIRSSGLLISDSGGLQEEASYFLKPIIVLRNYTERQESIQNNMSVCYNDTYGNIIDVFENMLNMKFDVSKKYLYGDGLASQRIFENIKSIIFQ
jgi:UDP-N-acetylglucosamine 2-epimerase (non-hydrolysing)